MGSRSGTQAAFLVLIAAQAAHSLEEIVFRLYDVFPPARMVSRLVSRDPAVGFIVVNAAIVAFGAWCYVARVRVWRTTSAGWIWPWVIVELTNGTVHTGMAVARGGYFPGVATAPMLLLAAGWLGGRLLVRQE